MLGPVCRHPGGRGHGPPEVRRPVGPGGWVALGPCAAPEIPAQGGMGARPPAKPPPPPAVPCLGSRGGGGGGGRAGGRRSAEQVLVVLVCAEFQAQVEVVLLLSGLVERLRLVSRGRVLHGEEGSQGLEEAGPRYTRWER